MAVVAMPGATDAAWPLAATLYAESSLRPASLDDAHARVLCGEVPAAGAATELRDLADTVAALHGDDAPTRALLGDIARRLGVRALVVVRVEGPSAEGGAGPRAVARVFLPDAGDFDAATYSPDAGTQDAWSGAARSLTRSLGEKREAPKAAAPPLAVRPTGRATVAPPGRPFYLSPWFWGAVGVAAAAGGAAYLLTRDTGSPTIHLQLQVPSQ